MEIVRTRVYERRIEKLLSIKERARVENEIAGDPAAWPVIQGTGGVRKARFSRDDLGKSGGGRIGYVFWEAFDTLYLLAAYAHNEKDNFSKAERNAMKALVKSLLEVERDERRRASEIKPSR
ncbi:MAG TPA: type II toxin-antitoxin system RelE/ParE family toxin [Stellaceae bacterium]|nr:type II toxin-antitoxin system RelE/ParE family toxin [Stellaceae bacterium]